jgi:hypothetical protein
VIEYNLNIFIGTNKFRITDELIAFFYSVSVHLDPGSRKKGLFCAVRMVWALLQWWKGTNGVTVVLLGRRTIFFLSNSAYNYMQPCSSRPEAGEWKATGYLQRYLY